MSLYVDVCQYQLIRGTHLATSRNMDVIAGLPILATASGQDFYPYSAAIGGLVQGSW